MDTNCSIVRTKFDERIVARTTAAKFRRRVTYSGVQERRIDPTPEVLMGTGWFCQELVRRPGVSILFKEIGAQLSDAITATLSEYGFNEYQPTQSRRSLRLLATCCRIFLP